MSEEKRRYVRWREKIRVAYSLDCKQEPSKEGFTQDLSEVGMRFLAKDNLELKQEISIKLEFAFDPVPILALGRIVSACIQGDSQSVGLEFIEQSDFQKQRLKKNIGRLYPETA